MSGATGRPGLERGEPSAPPPTRVLLVEDDEDDYLLTLDLLREIGGGRFAVDRAASYGEAATAMAGGGYDVYLVDYRLGPRDGLELLADAAPADTPVILLTGLDDPDVDLRAMAAGAADYLVKGRIDAPTLERSIRYAVERKRIEAELRRAHDEMEGRVWQRTAELERANAALREADRKKDEFLATLAHELRNPLAPIRMGLEVLRLGGDGPEAVDETLGTMESQVRQMVRLIDDLLDVSRITRGKLELRKARVELRDVLKTAVDTARPMVAEAGHELTVTLPAEPLALDGDPARLSQILSNLLNNSAKYTPEGGRIALTAERRGGEVAVSVKDSGVGIPPEMLERVFEMFTQVDRRLERSHGGLGIGLTLVRRLVEMHGGSVEARSEGEGRGSEFVVRLPLVVSPAASTPDAPLGRENVTGRRILVADDNKDAADMLSRVLRALGHEVVTAYDGQAAVEAAESYRPEVCLLDIGMPRLNGYDACRAIRREPWGGGMLLVALTGWGQEEDRRKSAVAGFDRHLVKPVEPAALQELLAGRFKPFV